MIQKPTKFLRLKDNHPTMVKLQELMTAAEKLGLWLEFGQGYCLLHDHDRPDAVLHVYDLDHEFDPIDTFPPTLDFKVLMDNPAYQEWVKQESERQDRELAKAMRLAEKKKKKLREVAELRAAEERAQAAIRLENAERAELARLKAKYKE